MHTLTQARHYFLFTLQGVKIKKLHNLMEKDPKLFNQIVGVGSATYKLMEFRADCKMAMILMQ